MKKCWLCKRYVMCKTHMGLCPICFANLMDIVLVLLSPLFVFIYIFLPIDLIPDFIPGPFAGVDDIVAVVVIPIITIIFAIVRIRGRTRRIT